MTRLGFVGYVNNSGLGAMAASFRKHLPLDSQFIIKHPIKGTHNIDIPHTFGDIDATEDQLNTYLDTCKPEVVIIIETPFNFTFFKILHDRDIKVVFIPMIDSIGVEKFKPYENYIDLVINVTKVGHKIYLDKWQGCGIHIPYPIDTEYFCPSNIEAEFMFAHSSGWGGSHYRKGTDLVFTAFQQLCHMCKVKPTLWAHGQPGEAQHSQLRQLSKDVAVIHQEDLTNAIDLYRKGRVCVFPSRREGLGLPILEAMSCGLPVITTDAAPMNERFPESYPLLVKVQCQSDLPYGDVPMYTPNAFDLMQKMKFAYDNSKEMEQLGEQNRIIIQEKYSWDVLRDTYLEFLDR